MNNNWSQASLIAAYGILGFLFLTITANAVALLFHGSVHSVFAVGAFVLSAMGVYKLSCHQKLHTPLLTLALFIATICTSVGLSLATTDLSWDGNSYHKTAIGAMRDGWNPVWQDINTYNAGAEYALRGLDGLDRSLDTPWVDHYPKATWLFASSLYMLTGSIESGKSFALLVLFAVFFMCYSYGRQKLSRNKAIIIAFLAAASPVAIAQISSYYNDGILGGLMTILFVLLTIILDKKAKKPGGEWLLYLGIIVVIAIASNIKFTGLAHAGIITVCYWVCILFRRDWHTALRLTIAGVVALIIGIGIIGSSSYVKNVVTHSNPLYPLIGKGSVDFISINQPLNIADESRLYKFIVTNLVGPTAQISTSQPEYYRYLHPKIPFSIAEDELRFLPGVDTRQGGYGVWFGGILILSFLFGVYILTRYGRENKRYLALFLLPFIATAIAAVMLDGSWWARYLPFLPLLPLIVAIALFMTREKILPFILIFTMLFNVTLLGVLGIGEQIRLQNRNQNQIDHALHCVDDKSVQVFSSARLDGALYNLRDRCSSIQSVGPMEFNRWKSSAIELPYGIFLKTDGYK